MKELGKSLTQPHVIGGGVGLVAGLIILRKASGAPKMLGLLCTVALGAIAGVILDKYK